MANTYLHVDQTWNFIMMMERYGWETDRNHVEVNVNSDIHCLKREVLCRITALVQTLLILAFGTLKQAVRAATFLITAILTCDLERLKFACKDILSIIVHAVVMPVLGIVATFAPSVACLLAAKWVGSDDKGTRFTYMSSHCIQANHHYIWPLINLRHKVKGESGIVAKAFALLTAPIQGIAIAVSSFVRALFTFEVGYMSLCFPLTILTQVIPLTGYGNDDDLIEHCGPMTARSLHGFY